MTDTFFRIPVNMMQLADQLMTVCSLYYPVTLLYLFAIMNADQELTSGSGRSL